MKDFPRYEELLALSKAQSRAKRYNPRDHWPFFPSRTLNWAYRLTIAVLVASIFLGH